MCGQAVQDFAGCRLEIKFSGLEGQHWAWGVGKDTTDGGMVSVNGRELRGAREGPKKANFLETHSGELFACDFGSRHLWGSWNWTHVSVGFTSFPLYQSFLSESGFISGNVTECLLSFSQVRTFSLLKRTVFTTKTCLYCQDLPLLPIAGPAQPSSPLEHYAAVITTFSPIHSRELDRALTSSSLLIP